MKIKLRNKVAALLAAAVVGGTGAAVAQTNYQPAEAATQTMYNLSDSSNTFRVFWTSNCTGNYKVVPIGGKQTGGGKYFRSWLQPAYTAGKMYVGVFSLTFDGVTSHTCRSDTRGPFAWEKVRLVKYGQGSW